MSTDVDLIRRMYDAVAVGDLREFGERLHPDVVWEHNIGGGSLEEGTYRGREEIKEIDDGALLIRGELRSKHSTTAAEIVTPFEQWFEIQDGLLVRARMRFGQLGAAAPAAEAGP